MRIRLEGYSGDAYSFPTKKSGDCWCRMGIACIHYGCWTVLVGGMGKCLSWPCSSRALENISVRYSGDSYSLQMRKNGGFIGGLGGQMTLAVKD